MNFLRIFIAITFLLLSSCREQPEYPPAFNTAEEMLARDPELSIRMLEELESDAAGYDEATRMRYELLKIRAHDKNYESLTSDSTIRLIKDYYERRGTAADRMTAYYYMGAYYRDSHDNVRALEWYHKAFEAADTAQPGFSYDIYNSIIMQISYICSDSDNHEEEAGWLRRIDLHRCPDKYVVWNDLADVYEELGKTDSAVYFYDLIFKNLKQEKKLTKRIRRCLNQQMAFFISHDDTARIRQRGPCFLTCRTQDEEGVSDLTFGIYYQYANRPDSALHYLRRATGGSRLTTVQDAYRRLYREYRALGRMDSAQYYCDRYMENTDSLEAQKQEERILKMNRLYDYQHELRENERLREQNFSNRFRLMACSFALVCVIVIFLARRRAYRNRILAMTREQLASESLRRNEARSEAEDLFCRQEKENLYRKIRSREPLVEEDQAALEKLAEHECPGLGKALGSLLPPLPRQEFLLCELAVIGIKGTAAAVLLGGGRQYVHQMSVRLCRRLSGGKGGNDLREVLKELSRPYGDDRQPVWP